MSACHSLAAVLLVLLVAACGPQTQGGEPPAPSDGEGTPIVSTLPVPPTEPAPSSGGRNLEAVNLCTLISNAEIAELMGAEPTRGDLEGVTGPNCVYQITPDGGSTIQNVYVYLYEQALAEASLALLGDAGATQLDGLGSAAMVLYEADNEQYRLAGLRSGDFGFEILSPSEEGARKLAELILERLP